jgi:uncharacterized protein YaiL (DUF2058 family)
MGNSLQEQLIKAGLADEKQARKARAPKQHQKKKKGQRNPQPGESARAARQVRAEKAARDRALNEKRQAKAERKALVAQIRQLIDENRLERGEDAEIGYYFQDGDKIRKIFVTESMQRQLGDGQLEIVRLGGRYDLVPPAVADKIRQRDPVFVVERRVSEQEPAEDDPYKDYKVPDDLMW